MNERDKGCLTLKEPFGKDFRLGSGTMLLFKCSDFRPLFSRFLYMGEFHVADNEVEEY
jgi:hypothetical protein